MREALPHVLHDIFECLALQFGEYSGGVSDLNEKD